ncbi:hypothetical protein OH799_32575 [Nocardia sp. NBC_00881]|uniref:hypothetical protein n=1 Tax=Nocardia sp. NBC_00881 TaxID=2975995 RepID=UPI00386702B4|nr:hypothetical protein OH799_32575 [Nocardia sp. NBC_00881]
MTLLRDLITIPTSVSDGDFVVKASEGADLANYVVTEQLRDDFGDALRMVGHAVTTGRSQAAYLHGSFGSGKSHFMSVLREILQHNNQARAIPGLAAPIAEADSWLPGRKVLCLTFHLLGAQSVEQAVLEGYLNQITALHPEAPPPAVHRSDRMLADAATLRQTMTDEKFFEVLGNGGQPGSAGAGLASMMAQRQGWTAQSYDAAAAAAPGTKERDSLVSALTTAFYTGAVRSGEYLDLDTGLQVVTRHAKSLGYDVAVLFLDELILWLSTRMSDITFVNTEGAKLNKLVESSDAARPLPLVSFIAKQRNLEEFLGPQVGGTEREVLADVMRSGQGRFDEIVLADTNLPEITEGRLLRPGTETVPKDEARRIIDEAFEAVRGNREVWDILLSGAQYGDAGIGSDRATFRRLYPFSPALVATLVALSQALQRERTALRVMTELLVERRNTLQVNDVIGVAALFDPLVLHGALPDRPQLKQQFQAARDTYRQKLRPLLLALNGIAEEQAAGHEQFQLDDRLVRTLMVGALVPEVPALHNLTASRLHALNFGSISAPIPGYENQTIISRLSKLADDAGELHKTDGPDPVFSLKLSAVDYDKLLELVPHNETATGVLQQLVRDMVCVELGVGSSEGTFGELAHMKEWRGRRHQITVKFGNVRDRETMPDATLYAEGETWRVIIDYPFDNGGNRRDDLARIEGLERDKNTVFWLPYFLSDDLMVRLGQLAKINYLLGSGGTGDRLTTLAADWSIADRQQGKIYLQQRQQHLKSSLLDTLKLAYGVVKPRQSDTAVELDTGPVLVSLREALPLGDPRGGTVKAAFDNLTSDLLDWSFPGTPCLPVAEKPVTKGELNKVLGFARAAATDEARRAKVEGSTDQKTVQRICNNLQLGEIVENQYVLNATTCWWSTHLVREAAKDGYTEQFPVQVLRPLLDKPSPRGFERDLQNLILAVFAHEQQLAWYQHDGKIDIQAVQQITDSMMLKRPPMPEQDIWDRAVRRAKPIFGIQLAEYRTPATLEDFGTKIRSVAKVHVTATDVLVTELTEHAGVLGLDTEARSGRLATARRVAKLLREIASETDDAVLVGMVADAEVGEIEDLVAGTSFKQSDQVKVALAGTQWDLLDAVAQRASHDGGAKLVIDELRAAAGYEQSVCDLAAALKNAVSAAAALLVKPVPPPAPPPAAVSKGDPTSTRVPTRQQRDVADTSAIAAVMAEIENEVTAGHNVRISWEVIGDS